MGHANENLKKLGWIKEKKMKTNCTGANAVVQMLYIAKIQRMTLHHISLNASIKTYIFLYLKILFKSSKIV